MVTRSNRYVPVDRATALRKQAINVWLIASSVVFVWAGVIVAAPLLKAGGIISISTPLYSFFSILCHQIPDRSFHIAGEPFAVCSRCSGVYFGLLFGFVIYPLWRNIDEIEPLPKFWLILSLIPMTIDWSLTVCGVWENTYLSRFITGIIVGAACICRQKRQAPTSLLV